MKTLLQDIVIPAGTVFAINPGVPTTGSVTINPGLFQADTSNPDWFCDGDVLATMVSAEDPHSVIRTSGIPVEAALRHAFKEIDRLAYELIRREGADKMLQDAAKKEENAAESVKSAREMCIKVAEAIERPRHGVPKEYELARLVRQEIEKRFPQ